LKRDSKKLNSVQLCLVTEFIFFAVSIRTIECQWWRHNFRQGTMSH